MRQECNPGDSHAPLAKEQEPFTGEPVPADRAENSSAGTKPERQKERNHMGDKRIEMLHGQRKRAAAPVTDPGNKLIEMLHAQRKRADTNSDRPGRLMNRNAAWPTKSADTSSDRPGRQNTGSDRPGRQMNRNATWPTEKGGHQQ